jgi:hypothetical protein
MKQKTENGGVRRRSQLKADKNKDQQYRRMRE